MEIVKFRITNAGSSVAFEAILAKPHYFVLCKQDELPRVLISSALHHRAKKSRKEKKKCSSVTSNMTNTLMSRFVEEMYVI